MNACISPGSSPPAQARGPSPICLRVWGERASFTTYDSGGERETYAMLHPVAAEAVLKAVYWHPGFAYEIRRIDVLSPVQIYAERVNELSAHAGARGLDITQAEVRTIRQRRIIHQPHYAIYANVVIDAPLRSRERYGKILSIFERRADRGQCHERPYLGIREAPCDFGRITVTNVPAPWDVDADLGPLPLWRDYVPDDQGAVEMVTHRVGPAGTNLERRVERGHVISHYFQGTVRGGRLHVPAYRSAP